MCEMCLKEQIRYLQYFCQIVCSFSVYTPVSTALMANSCSSALLFDAIRIRTVVARL